MTRPYAILGGLNSAAAAAAAAVAHKLLPQGFYNFTQDMFIYIQSNLHTKQLFYFETETKSGIEL